jgi:large subunit ribosomal protein L25
MLGQNLRVSDLPLGPKVKVLTDPNRAVCHVVVVKVEEEKPAEVAAEAAPAEPEVIHKGKAEEEGAEAEAGEEKKDKGDKREKGEKKEKGKEKG